MKMTKAMTPENTPMPTVEDWEKAYKSFFVARFVGRGVPQHVGETEWDACYESLGFDELRVMDPADAADECMSAWDAD